MKILLVNAPVVRNNGKVDAYALEKANFLNSHKTLKKIFDCKISYGNRAGSRWPEMFESDIGLSWNYPFIMALTTSFLRSNGYTADMIDCVAEHCHSYRKFFKRVKKYNADIVIIETSTPTIDIDLFCAKKISCFTKVALSGPHITDDTINTLIKENPYVDFWLKGEYIKSSLSMVKTLRKGIYEIEPIEDINKLPFMARDFLGFDSYYDMTVNTDKPQLFMFGSKGCPFNCTYCLWPATMYKRTSMYRTPENIIEEIKQNLSLHKYNSIYFDDDTWNVGTERISKLCDMLKEIGLPWSMMGRLDCSPDWLFDKMVECGCKGMRFGIETFNVEVLKNINKKLERIDIQKTLKHLCDKYPNLWLHICMMKNLPGQTKEMHEEDMKIIKDLGFSTENGSSRFYQLSSCVPFPGTEMYKSLVEKYGKEKMNNWKLYDGGKDSIITHLK